MDIRIAELREHAERFHGTGDKQRLLHVCGEIGYVVATGIVCFLPGRCWFHVPFSGGGGELFLQQGIEQILCVQDSAVVIQALAANGKDILWILADQAQVRAQRVVEIEPQHLRPRRHDGGDRLVGQVENTIHHGLLAFFERAILRSLFDEFLDIILGNGIVRPTAMNPKRSEQQVGAGTEPVRQPLQLPP